VIELLSAPNLQVLSTILVVVIGIIKYKTLNLPLRVLFYLIILSLLTDFTCYLLVNFNMYNLWVINTYTILEFLFFSIFYLSILKSIKQIKLLSLFYLLSLIAVTIITFAQSFTLHLSQITLGIESIIFICSSAIYFNLMLKKLEYSTPWSNPLFWLNSAILIYFSGCFFVFIFSEYRAFKLVIMVWDLHNIIRIIFNMLIIIGFWKARKELI